MYDLDAAVATLHAGKRPIKLVRPATLGDGVRRLPPARYDALESRWAEAKDQGRLSLWVPAAGAATRMWDGMEALDAMDEEALAQAPHPLATALRNLDSLAVWPAVEAETLRERLSQLRRLTTIPKVLFPFHRSGGAPHRPLDAHAEDALALAKPREGRAALHLVVAPEHLARVREGWRTHPLAGRVELNLAVQPPESDTPWLARGELARDAGGALVRRAGGHGALLPLLSGIGDVVLVKNVDSVLPPERARGWSHPWRRRLVGHLACVEAAVHGWTRYLAEGGDPAPVRDFVEETFFLKDTPRDRSALLALLHRPIRAVGVVVSRGEPGGGPFWVAEPGLEARPQIVELSQVDLADPAQRAVWAASTHFNPVDMVLSTRDFLGRPFDLSAFAQRDAWLVLERTLGLVPSTLLEHPGLWNGGMAHWNTSYVEIGEESFAPVKRLADLLRPEHSKS